MRLFKFYAYANALNPKIGNFIFLLHYLKERGLK